MLNTHLVPNISDLEGYLIRLKTAIVVISRKRVNTYSAGIDFSRHNLTSKDGRFWQLKSIPAL